MSHIKKAANAIRRARSIAISGHANPDGDSVGSLLGLGLGLRSLGKQVYLLCQDELPLNYRHLPGAGTIIKTTRRKIDLAIAVDCSMIDVLEKNIPVFNNARSVLEIDHHDYKKPFGDILLIEREAAAVGEIVYDLLKELKVKITRSISKNLLTSIIVETNLFKLGKIRALTFKACAELISCGVDFVKLSDLVYGPRSREAAILSAMCLERAKFLKHGKIIWSILRKKDFARAKGKYYDSDAIANEMRSIKGVQVVILFKEKEKGFLKVSLRSKGGINVGRIAQAYGGGGHNDIAGFTISNTAEALRGVLGSAMRAV